jgi:hypothetical protein
MAHPLGFLYSVEWLNPNTQPPNGKPRITAALYLRCDYPGQGARLPAEIEKLHELGDGYTVAVAAILPEPKRWTPERKFAYRRRMLENRMRKKYPMFSDQYIQEVLTKKPAYFGL